MIAVAFLTNHYIEYQGIFGLPEYVCDLIFALPVAVLITIDFPMPRISPFLSGLNRQMADFSYSLYAYHLPLMYFVYAGIAQTPLRLTPLVGLGVILIVGCLLISKGLYYISENKRRIIRRWGEHSIGTIEVLLSNRLHAAIARPVKHGEVDIPPLQFDERIYWKMAQCNYKLRLFFPTS
jgi:peptidoglycan/LPS O-acetylase OafA/YrhL